MSVIWKSWQQIVKIDFILCYKESGHDVLLIISHKLISARLLFMMFLFFIDIIILMLIIPWRQQWAHSNGSVSLFCQWDLSGFSWAGQFVAVSWLLFELMFLSAHTRSWKKKQFHVLCSSKEGMVAGEHRTFLVCPSCDKDCSPGVEWEEVL